MKLPFFASFIIFCTWLTFTLVRVRRKEEHANDAFWEREALANSTRKQPLDTLPYVTIPYENLPFSIMADDENVAEYHRIMETLRDKKIVNFTGQTNTDLKLAYGAPNITLLTSYDQNYTTLVRTLQKWAELLFATGYVNETVTLLEFAVSTHTDVSATYRLLASIYHDKQETDKIELLKETAAGLKSAMRPAILRNLEEYSVATDTSVTG